MDRSVEWRYAYPFRVTPPFGGDGHWEGSGYHWEQSGSGYIQVAGDVWYDLIITVDEGYRDPSTNQRIEYPLEIIIDYTDYDLSGWRNTWLKNGNTIDPESVGEQGIYVNDNLGEDWIIYNTEILQAYQEGDMTSLPVVGRLRIYAYRMDIVEGAYHSILIDYWNAYKYENLQWQLIESGIRRNHV